MRWQNALLGAFVCAVACADASGSFVRVRDAEGGESSLGSPGGYYLEGTGSLARAALDGSPRHAAMGVFDFELSYGGTWEELLTFCTEPDIEIGFDEWPGDPDGFLYESVPLASGGFSDADALVLETLWANAYTLTLGDRTAAGAFQTIVWELIRDTEIDFTSGSFALIETHPDTGAFGALARTWLDNIESGAWSGRVALHVLTTPFSQNLLMPKRFLPAPGTPAVVGCIAVVWRRKRR